MQKNLGRDYKIVSAEDTKGRTYVGFQIKKPGVAIWLRNITPVNLRDEDKERFNVLYFRTESGNIYRFDAEGMLTDGDRSMKSGTAISKYMPFENIRAQSIAVGIAFPQTRIDGNVVEVVGVRKERYTPEKLKDIPIESESSIIRDFEVKINGQSIDRGNTASYLRATEAPRTEQIQIDIDFREIHNSKTAQKLGFEGQVSDSKNFGELYKALIKMGSVVEGSEVYKSADIVNAIEAFRDGREPLTVVVTAYGIRKKVWNLSPDGKAGINPF